MKESPKHTPDLECFGLSEMLRLPSSLGYGGRQRAPRRARRLQRVKLPY